jgi:predicted acyltransferase
VFPAFLFAVGNAMAFSMQKFEGQQEMVFWKKTIIRTLVIFLIGVLLYYFPFYDFKNGGFKSLANARIPGVLQRIALCYFFASVIIRYGSTRSVVAWSALLLVGYWIILFAFGDPNDPYSLAGYAGNDLDLTIFGAQHLYHGEGVAFDPEGLLSTIPAIVNVTVGYLAGVFIRTKSNLFEIIAKLMVASAVLIFIALCWHLAFPINKKIWTSSFVLLTTGLSLAILSILIYIIQVSKKEKWTRFFTVFGKNPLFIYMMSGILINIFGLIPFGGTNLSNWLFHDFFGSIASPIHASFMFALFYMLLNWLIGYFLDKKRIYIKV